MGNAVLVKCLLHGYYYDMSDIGLGSGIFNYIVLINFAAGFLIGGIPGFYLSFLLLTRLSKKHRSFWILLAILTGILCGYIGFSTVVNVFSSLKSIHDNLPWIARPSFVILEILLVVFHFLKTSKQKK